MLIDYNNIHQGPLARMEHPVLKPELANEKEGQVNQVVFCEGLVQFKGSWYLYFGQGFRIGCRNCTGNLDTYSKGSVYLDK